MGRKFPHRMAQAPQTREPADVTSLRCRCQRSCWNWGQSRWPTTRIFGGGAEGRRSQGAQKRAGKAGLRYQAKVRKRTGTDQRTARLSAASPVSGMGPGGVCFWCPSSNGNAQGEIRYIQLSLRLSHFSE